MNFVLVSSCLLGKAVRYDASHKRSLHSTLQEWVTEGRVIAVCPELAGGLPVPRPAAEIVGDSGGNAVWLNRARVHDRHNNDVTPAFIAGAHATLKVAQKHGVRVAVLKEGSPSCGSTEIYDGAFTGTRISGQGVTTSLLKKAGIYVFNEFQIDEAHACLQRLPLCAPILSSDSCKR